MAVTRKQLPNRETPANPAKVVGGDKPKVDTSVPSGASSLSSLFDKASSATSFGADIPPGDYEAILVYAKVEPKNDKGIAALFKYEVADEGDHQGKVLSSYYGLMKVDGSEGPGMGFFKRDLAKLGYPDIAGDDIEEALEQLMETQDGVSIKVKHKDGYTNVYLQGVTVGSEIVDEWKAKRPEQPY